MKVLYKPGTSYADLFTLDTPEGRAKLFSDRIDELMRQGLSLNDAVYELRLSEDPKDVALLEAMGETPSHARAEQLSTERRNQMLDRLAEENASASKPSAEVAAAMARNIAFNARITELMGRGLTIDQAVNNMRANEKDAALLAAMGG